MNYTYIYCVFIVYLLRIYCLSNNFYELKTKRGKHSCPISKMFAFASFSSYTSAYL